MCSVFGMMLEKEIERKCCQLSKSFGWLSYKFVSPAQRGVPDRIFIKDSEVVFVEFKREGGKLSALQNKVIEDMRSKGATVYVVYSVEQFKEIFKC